MASLVSLQTLQTRVLQRANLEGAFALISTTELNDMINASLARWYDIVRLTTFGGQMYRSQQSITILNNQSLYALATDFLALLSVDIFPAGLGANQAFMAQPYQEEQHNMFRNVGVWAVGYPLLYQLQGTSINFIPTPLASTAVQVNYVPVAPVLVNITDTFDSVNAWDEWIVLDAAMKALTKDGQTDIVSLLRAERAEWEAAIRAAVPSRDQTGVERVHEVEGWYGSGAWNGGW